MNDLEKEYSTWTTELLLDHMSWLSDQEVREGEDWADDIIAISNVLEERERTNNASTKL
jgi:hypothetical protein